MMALSHSGATVEAMTTVTGNVHVDWVTRNVFTVLDIVGATVPVYRGADTPLMPGYWEPETRVHGEDGLGNYRRRGNQRHSVEPEHAASALVRLANEAPGEYTLVALGPLTNVALACKLDPEFPEKIRQFVFMGGTISALGNTTNVTAEFNLYCDPEAALIALAAFPMSTMLSWETTIKHSFTWEAYDALTTIPSDAGRFFHETTQGTVAYLRQFRERIGYLLPDPLAMAITLEPDIILNAEEHYVTVEVRGEFTRGQTVIDYFGLKGQESNVRIVTELDTDRVYQMFQQMLAG